MSKFKIQGGTPLQGEILVAGNKNAALPIIAATVLTDEPCRIDNLPDILDVQTMLNVLADLGKQIHNITPNSVEISGSISKNKIEAPLARQLRASILYLGGLLNRTGSVHMAPPGGCVIGRRNVDSHFDVFKSFGAQLTTSDKDYHLQVRKPKAANLFLKETSVTATENALIFAAAITGTSVIENTASEPHVTDLCQVLQKMGAIIEGQGTNKLIITGKKQLSGFEHTVVADHIEAGTFAIAAACTGGNVIIHQAIKKHLVMTEYYLQLIGVPLHFRDKQTLEIRPSQLSSQGLKFQTGLWPAFPTDLMSPLIVLATQAQGTTLCHDWMYESRMFFVDKLIVMGAQITQCDPHRVLVTGPTKLRGQELSSPDIRAGIALVIAALSAKGTSIIDRAELIDRGYENITERLQKLGASIERLA
jgi:UDP-N-acetylglucosamine 1-carboxyvinyltransferase